MAGSDRTNTVTIAMVHIGFYLRVATVIVDALAAGTAGSGRVQGLLLGVQMATGVCAASATTSRATIVRDRADRLVFLVRSTGDVLLRFQ